MANEFFNDLSERLTKTAQGLSKSVGDIYDTQKKRSKISGEERMAEKLMTDIGRIVYSRYEEKEDLDSELLSLCVEIRQHMDNIEELKEDVANKKGQKICPACKKSVDKEASFCPYCGTAVPDPEPAEEEIFEEEEETAEEAVEEAAEAAEDAVDEAEQMMKEASDAAAEAVEAAKAAVEGVFETPEEKTEE